MFSTKHQDKTLGDFVKARRFPAVITGAHIRELRENPDSDETLDFVGGYLGFDARSHHALEALLTSLSGDKGGAFWLNGVYGAGKSHLLGAVALLCDGAAHEVFGALYPAFAPLLKRFAPRLVISIALDDYSARTFDLEGIFWRELDTQAARQNLNLPARKADESRAENFAQLENALRENGLSGLVICIDEVSLFLGGREREGLQSDAAFLQFLGQHSRRSALWIVGAIQKTVEDIGDLETYSLSQIRDRFTTLPLSLAHLPALVEARLRVISDAQAVDELCAQTFAAQSEALPRLDFGPQEWRALFPFHPSAIDLLEKVTSRFFSRTRSAALFCVHALDKCGDEAATARVGPERIWDYFVPELESHPDLRALGEVWESWEPLAASIAPSDSDDMRRTMKFLLVSKIAGQNPTPLHVANALGFDVGLGGDGNLDYARQLLEKLRRNAPFVALERGDEALGDRYAIDLGKRVGELARRQIAQSAEGLSVGDARLMAQALRAAGAEPMPLSQLSGGNIATMWANSPRAIAVDVESGASAATLANRILSTREAGALASAFLLILPPFSLDEWDRFGVINLLEDPRDRAAFWMWKPRPPARDEWELCRESEAARLAASDPALADNRRGRAITEHLEKGASARDAQLARVVTRLYLEGELVLGTGVALEAAELARGETFAALLESVADFALPQLFPRWPEIAPRARLLTPSNADALCLEILRRPTSEPFFAPSLERLARHVAMPLGLATSSAGRWKIAPGLDAWREPFIQSVGGGATLSALEAMWAKNEWGWPAETFALAVCALLRDGELSALDARGQVLSPAQIGLPLRRSVHSLKPGELPDNQMWTRAASFAHVVLREKVGAPSFEATQQLAARIANWQSETTRELELARARAAQCRRQLNHDSQSWPHFEAASNTIGEALQSLPRDGAPDALIAATANVDGEALARALRELEVTGALLETRLPTLLSTHAMLGDGQNAAPSQLSQSRGELRARFAAGESTLRDDDLLESAAKWNAEYAESYAQWHGAQHDAARWNSLRRLNQSDGLRALERLAILRHRPLEGGAKIREMLDGELSKFCARDGQLERGGATCASCDLRWGERLQLADPIQIAAQIENGLAPLRDWLADKEVRPHLERRRSALLDWNGQASELSALLTPATLADLDAALAPRRRVTRSMGELESALKECRTQSECAATFAIWLDGGQGLAGEDEIAWQD